MVAVELDETDVATMRQAGLGDALCVGSHVTTASHRAVLEAGLSLHGRAAGVHLSHADALTARTPARPRNAALEKRLEALRARQLDAEYRRMVSDVARNDTDETVGRVMREAAPAVSVAFNVLATMGTCFAVAYFLVKETTGNKALALGMGAVALAGALAVEATLVLTRMYRADKTQASLEGARARKVLRRAANDAKRKSS